MDEKLKTGDAVKLSSDAQLMTIEEIQEGTAFCAWIYKGEKRRGQFALDMLVKINPEDTAFKVIQTRPSIVDEMRGKYFPEKR